jgi:hypothetical protein
MVTDKQIFTDITKNNAHQRNENKRTIEGNGVYVVNASNMSLRNIP